MNENIQLYSLVRSGASIYLARLDRVEVSPEAAGQQKVSLRLVIEQTLWNEPGAPVRQSAFTEPESEIARLKFPHPRWGQVNLSKGVLILLVTHELSSVPADPLYVEEIAGLDDPILHAIRGVLQQEQAEPDPQARRARYLNYLIQGSTVEKLFGGEALARDQDLPEVDRQGVIATTMADVFADDGQSIFVRLTIGLLMWEKIYSRSTTEGRVAAINATIKTLEDDSEDVRRLSLNYLTNIDPDDLREPGIVSSQPAIVGLRERLSAETDPEIRAHLQKLLDVLTERT